ncbi:hypothetical protein HF086_007893 [Spodoptera exigua]|uniref:Uncharacterized protein n=1 Tax=Spodoptera exigua TaxID=7107 RepID=A0A922MYI2_SPOEX|nr:hypothetical protein HF086_007893 [Spodoptera exigua]
MVTNIYEPEGKILKVVFERKKWPSCNSERLNIVRERKHEKFIQNQSDHEEKTRYECHMYKDKELDLDQDTMKKKYPVSRAELDETEEEKHKTIITELTAVKTAQEREDTMTDKFLVDIESLVARFKMELDKMQELVGSILKNLPQGDVGVDIRQSNITTAS